MECETGECETLRSVGLLSCARLALDLSALVILLRPDPEDAPCVRSGLCASATCASSSGSLVTSATEPYLSVSAVCGVSEASGIPCIVSSGSSSVSLRACSLHALLHGPSKMARMQGSRGGHQYCSNLRRLRSQLAEGARLGLRMSGSVLNMTSDFRYLVSVALQAHIWTLA